MPATLGRALETNNIRLVSSCTRAKLSGDSCMNRMHSHGRQNSKNQLERLQGKDLHTAGLVGQQQAALGAQDIQLLQPVGPALLPFLRSWAESPVPSGPDSAPAATRTPAPAPRSPALPQHMPWADISARRWCWRPAICAGAAASRWRTAAPWSCGTHIAGSSDPRRGRWAALPDADTRSAPARHPRPG